MFKFVAITNNIFPSFQVQMICERLLKEQEARLRNEYETVLNNKLQG